MISYWSRSLASWVMMWVPTSRLICCVPSSWIVCPEEHSNPCQNHQQRQLKSRVTEGHGENEVLRRVQMRRWHRPQGFLQRCWNETLYWRKLQFLGKHTQERKYAHTFSQHWFKSSRNSEQHRKKKSLFLYFCDQINPSKKSTQNFFSLTLWSSFSFILTPLQMTDNSDGQTTYEFTCFFKVEC